MSTDTATIEIPDIGDFTDVDVIEILVKPGDAVAVEDPLITLETDKATFDVPSPQCGSIKQVLVKVGDKVSQGTPIITLNADQKTETPAESATQPKTPEQPAGSKPAATATTDHQPAIKDPGIQPSLQTQVLVLGAGPGGYTAAFRAADLGLKVVLVERYPNLGGVCLNVGCIPSKALLHAAHIINEAAAFAGHGIEFGAPKIDLAKLLAWKNGVTGKLTAGLAQLAKQRKVQVIEGTGHFVSPHHIEVEHEGDQQVIAFEHCIIAAGSQSTRIPGFPNDDPRLMDSTDALALADIPKRLLIVGGGIIGLEIATVYDALGSKITLVELTRELIPGCDRDLVRPLERRIKQRYEQILLNTKVTGIKPHDKGLEVHLEDANGTHEDVFDRVLIAVGRNPNGKQISADNAGLEVDDRGFIHVDRQQRTNVPHIFAIGDIVGQPMLAHKATHEGKVAAEVIAGQKSFFDARTIPSVAYTDPEVAWMGLTESEAKAQGIEYKKGAFPWAASGRSLSLGRDEGMTKLLFDKHSKHIIGAGIVGPNAGELIAETVLALEMGADASDIGLTIHPHPTLSETASLSAEAVAGTITDLYLPKRKTS
ncbi:MAG: dihydrolipoyl dehydrogenase [Gammaproteobacteria bacterium]|nr:MAG: dihydrolipoyl dehydrogenase [Gammaproteobacteria bacterium]